MWHPFSQVLSRLQGARIIAYYLKSKISSSIKAEKALNWFSSGKTIPLSVSVKWVVDFCEPWNHKGLCISHIFVYQCFFSFSLWWLVMEKLFSPFRYSCVSAFLCVLWMKFQKLTALNEQDVANALFSKLLKNRYWKRIFNKRGELR